MEASCSGLSATVVPTAAVIVTVLIAASRANRAAHSGIVARVEAVADRADIPDSGGWKNAPRSADALAAALDAQRQALEAVARDLSFLAGRQAERDRNPDAGGGGVIRAASVNFAHGNNEDATTSNGST